MAKWIALILSIATLNAFAEYRVYQYIIQNKVLSSPDSPKSNIVTSTLDPTSYLAYNGGGNLINVNILRTWMCPGNTAGFKEFCQSPYGKVPKELL